MPSELNHPGSTAMLVQPPELSASLVHPAPLTGMQWNMRLDTPHEGYEDAFMDNATQGIADLRERVGGTLAIGTQIVIVSFQVRCGEIYASEVR